MIDCRGRSANLAARLSDPHMLHGSGRRYLECPAVGYVRFKPVRAGSPNHVQAMASVATASTFGGGDGAERRAEARRIVYKYEVSLLTHSSDLDRPERDDMSQPMCCSAR